MYDCVQNFRRSSISKAVEYRFKEKINLKSAHLHDIVTSEGSVKYPQHTEVSIPVYLRQPQVCV